MNGLNGAHLAHLDSIPNGGSSMTGQAEFIKTSLEWITKEIVSHFMKSVSVFVSCVRVGHLRKSTCVEPYRPRHRHTFHA